jgi:hypothetical protein
MKKIVLLLILLPSLVLAQDEYGECFKKLNTQFESKSWEELLSFRKETECKYGAVYEEVWADIITYNLEAKWKYLPELAALAPSGSEQRTYVINSIDVTCPIDRCNIILERSIHQCPEGQEILCKDIELRIIEIDKIENQPNK